MARDDPKPKFGSGHLSAFLRQGLRELRAAFYPESNVAQQAEYGIYGTKTPGEVASDKKNDARDAAEVRELNEEPSSVLGDRLKQIEATRDGHERDAEKDKEIERE